MVKENKNTGEGGERRQRKEGRTVAGGACVASGREMKTGDGSQNTWCKPLAQVRGKMGNFLPKRRLVGGVSFS